MPLGQLLLGFVGGLVTDVARGMSLDRLRGRIEQAAQPDVPPKRNQLDLLSDISAQLREQNRYNEAHGPGASPVEFVAMLYRGAGLERGISRQGRKHLSIMPVNTGVVLAIISPVGRATYTLTPGVYTVIDAPEGTVYRLDDTSLNATENLSVRLYN